MSRIEGVPARSWEAWVAESGATVLDVREPVEWAMGTLPGALQIRMGELLSRIDELDPHKPVLVVCRSGERSLRVATYLVATGFIAANMDGGMKALGMQD